MRDFRVAYDAINEANLAVQDYVAETAVSCKPPGESTEKKILRLRELMSETKELSHQINKELAWL